jgi:hypothetical protein
MASFSYVDLSTLKVFSRLVYGRLDCVPTSLLRVGGGPPKEIFRDPKESKVFCTGMLLECPFASHGYLKR